MELRGVRYSDTLYIKLPRPRRHVNYRRLCFITSIVFDPLVESRRIVPCTTIESLMPLKR
jgi:hypothetical protein